MGNQQCCGPSDHATQMKGSRFSKNPKHRKKKGKRESTKSDSSPLPDQSQQSEQLDATLTNNAGDARSQVLLEYQAASMQTESLRGLTERKQTNFNTEIETEPKTEVVEPKVEPIA